MAPETTEILENLGKRLGKMTVEKETENITEAIEKLKKEENDVEAEYKKDAALLKRLGVTVSAFVVLVLI